jgi:hypothetical protein
VLRGGSGTDTLDGGNGKDTCSSGEKYVSCESEPADPGYTTTVTGSQDAKITLRSPDRIPKVDVSVRSDYERSQLAQKNRVSYAYQFSSADPFTDADITIPYFPKAAGMNAAGGGGGPPALRIYGYDEKYGLWVPTPGRSVVDPVAHTVTATVQHLSLYTAFLEQPGVLQFENYWDTKPVWCLPQGDPNAPNFNVGFVVADGANLATSDPNGLRAEAAKRFVDAMRPGDLAAVIGFNDTTTTYQGLTPLNTPDNVAAVKAALDQTKTASGGNNLDAAVSAGTHELSSANTPGRPRIGILVSDGPGPLSETTISEAIANDVVYYTIGVGTGDTHDLKTIADKTGGRYLTLTNPAQLPTIYQELSRDLIDDGTDTDHDGVTDCVERRGALVARDFYLFGLPDQESRFIRTDPTKPDTDGDGLSDGAELGPRLDLRNDPTVADTYKFLVGTGIDYIYNATSDPTNRDTDGDGLSDPQEKVYHTDAWVRDTDGDGSNDYEEVSAGLNPTEPTGWIWAGKKNGTPAQIPACHRSPW